ncbi:MAG: DUF302 domain-containing protein [Hyphomicrobiaceae bacterium]|nr:DUF302 domain-containing protein [Hyphomicrobiaceae bacterium]
MRRIVVSFCFALMAAMSAQAGDFVSQTKSGSFDDVRFELGNAIVTRGLNVHSEGNLEAMMRRTGADVGSSVVVYKNAQFVQFCSALLSRKLAEIDPITMGYCPFGVFVYETAAKPGEIVVGYRRLASTSPSESALDKAKANVDALLAGIVADAVK